MVEIIKELHLGQWSLTIVIICVIWNYILKGLFEKWVDLKVEKDKQNVQTALQLQKDLTIKQAEFEQVKLQRVLPKLELIHKSIVEHRMMFNTYISAIGNKHHYPENLEQLRLEQDSKIIDSISSIAIYLPEEFRKLLYRIRKVVSCSWRDPLITCKILRQIGNAFEVCDAAQDLHSDLIDCFYTMCNKYIGESEDKTTYHQILTRFNLDSEIDTTKVDPINTLALKFILLHEYYGSSEQVDAQVALENFYEKINQGQKLNK